MPGRLERGEGKDEFFFFNYDFKEHQVFSYLRENCGLISRCNFLGHMSNILESVSLRSCQIYLELSEVIS